MNPRTYQKKLSKIQRNPLLTAEIAGLEYISDLLPGYSRKKRGKNFIYLDTQGKICKDKAILERIRSLILPPAWENVWICSSANGHLQATGIDSKGRKQYRYHPLWNRIRSQTKYLRLPQFAEALPLIREKVDKDLRLKGFVYEKVLALVISILEQTNIRIGNEAYKKLYGSFGLTTLQNKHVKVEGKQLRFMFKGKKGVYHNIRISSQKLARLVQQCKEIPGKELFQYIDENGNRHSVSSGDVNHYLKEITGNDFTAKDFRTWAGTVTAYSNLGKSEKPASESETKRVILQTLDEVALHLGNTRTVCRKYYVHPAITTAFEKGELTHFAVKEPEDTKDKQWLTEEEQSVKKLLEKYVFQVS